MQLVRIKIRLDPWDSKTIKATTTTTVEYTLPTNSSALTLIGNEQLSVHRISVDYKSTKNFELSRSTSQHKVTIFDLPANGTLRITAHQQLTRHNEDYPFYKENLKELAYLPENSLFQLKIKEIKNNISKKEFTVCYDSNILILYAGKFKKSQEHYINTNIVTHTLNNNQQQITFLTDTIKKFINWQVNLNIPLQNKTYRIITIPRYTYNPASKFIIIDSSVLPSSLQANTLDEYNHATLLLLEKYLDYQKLHNKQELIERFLETNHGVHEAKIIKLSNNKIIPDINFELDSDINKIDNLDPVQIWLITQKCINSIITNLIANPYSNLNYKQYEEQVLMLSKLFLKTFYDTKMSLSSKAKIFTLPSQEKIIASNPHLLFNIQLLKESYDILENFLAKKFRIFWNDKTLLTNTESAYVCLKYQAKLKLFNQINLYKNTNIVDKILYALQANYTVMPIDNIIVDLHLRKDDLKKFSPIAIGNFIYTLFANNLNLLHEPKGCGYKLLTDWIIYLDGKDSNVSTNLLSLFNNWPQIDKKRYMLVKASLQGMQLNLDISPQLNDQITSALKIAETLQTPKIPQPLVYSKSQLPTEWEKILNNQDVKAANLLVERFKITADLDKHSPKLSN